MCIFNRKYSAQESEQKLADAIVFAMANNQLKSYKNLNDFVKKSTEETGVDPKRIKFKRIIITDEITKVLKNWKFFGYKCSNESLQSGIELLQSRLD